MVGWGQLPSDSGSDAAIPLALPHDVGGNSDAPLSETIVLVLPFLCLCLGLEN